MDKKIIINVGRQFGSGGRQVAVELGKRLGIPVYDNELISKAAEESGLSEHLFASKDEKRSLFSMSAFFSSGRFASANNYIGENELFKIQSEVIRSIAQKGSAIFIGRCSDYILRDMDCLDVFITAPEEERIKRVSLREGISEEEAGSLIKRRDHTRKSYYDYFTFGNWGVSSNYDLSIDSSILGIEETAEYIIDFLKRKNK